MPQDIFQRYQNFVARSKRQNVLKKVVSVVACTVIFCTTYALILPAITMEKETFCGIEEHAHSEACYEAVSTTHLVCTSETLNIHTHSDGCYDAERNLCCGQADYVAHSHADGCYNPKGVLVCTLSERTAHLHSEACYAPVETPAPVLHEHSDSCTTLQKGDLSCTQEEYEGHAHGEGCYEPGTELLCTTEENHVHGDSCRTYPLVCNLSTEPHNHTENCYSRGELNCPLTEEDHTHEDSCYESVVSCGKEDGEAHNHGEGCYSTEAELICNITENHVHQNSCYQFVCVCTIDEDPGHKHSDDCFWWTEEITCGLEEGQEEPVDPVEPTLICTEPVANVHVHGDECFETITIDAVPICGNTEEGHEHDSDCYNVICGIDPHSHSLVCYSNPEADLEDKTVWEATFAHITLTGNWNEDVLAIAETQLHYTESTRNYVVDEDETTRGYTRYGQWYGSPYGDWCAMFASFCLHYAEVENMPLDAGVQNWINELKEEELYREAGEYTPIPGDLVFYEWDNNNWADHVGIVVEVIEATDNEPAKLKSIEGNSSNKVQYVYHALDDTDIIGYSVLPEKEEEPAVVYYCGLEEHVHGDGCNSEDETQACQLTEHTHSEACTQETVISPCGMTAHSHNEQCYDAENNLICTITEHQHTPVCEVDLSALSEYDRSRVYDIMRRIEAMPSADEIDAKIAEFEAAEDYEGEELWMTEIYDEIGKIYATYSHLGEELQAYIVNRDKLLELEYIWSIMPLVDATVWLDGTNGGMTGLYGSDDTPYTVEVGATFTLPTTWKSPTKHRYKLRGWYQINAINRDLGDATANAALDSSLKPMDCYYAPGETVVITGDMVFYADWEAESYNIGIADDHVVNTVDTSDFIKTHVFDYSSIFNMYSSKYTGTVDANGHSETWSAIDYNQTLPNGQSSYGIILRDWDTGGNTKLSYPSNYSTDTYAGRFNTRDVVTTGLASNTPNPLALFFNTNRMMPILGTNHVGSANYLFQYDNNPSSEHYGYYYYDSYKNAASYNQSEGRFYVYDYLERTNTTNSAGGHDFLPFNSPYIHDNDSIKLDIQDGRYNYDHLTSLDTENDTYAGANFWYGMVNEIRFYLPDNSGTPNANHSLQGEDMVFEFSGDDDVWVFVDDVLILDIGGIHPQKDGSINFSTGEIIVDNASDTKKFSAGEHTLTMYYMERGSTMSNCSIYFNISPRYTLGLNKVDPDGELMTGSKFEIFMDPQQTIEAELWKSYEEYIADLNDASVDKSSNVLDTRTDGTATIWGFLPGRTYYIKETIPPIGQGYILPNGLIKMSLDTSGNVAIMIMDPTGPDDETINPSPGYIIREFAYNHSNQVITLEVQNKYPARDLYVKKIWEGIDFETVPVDVQLIASYVDAEGKTVQNTVETVKLNDANNWEHTWVDLPLYHTDRIENEDGTVVVNTRDITYTVNEIQVEGFNTTMEAIEKDAQLQSVNWNEVTSFENNNVYLLKTERGLLAADSNKGLYWTNNVNDAGAQWTATTDQLTLKNGNNLYLRSGTENDTHYFYADRNEGNVTFSNSKFVIQTVSGSNSTTYYMTGVINSSSGRAEVATSSSMTFALQERTITTSTAPADGYVITNIAVPNTTQLKVEKAWVDRNGAPADESLYNDLSVTIRVLANGEATTHTVELNKTNNWTHTFTGLPVKDEFGTIAYSVCEEWDNDNWTTTGPTYDAARDIWVVTNQYSRVVKIPVTKVWNEPSLARPITVQLYSVAKNQQVAELKATIELPTENNSWTAEFTGLIPPDEAEVTYYIYEPTTYFAVKYNSETQIYIPSEGEGGSKLVTVGQVIFPDDDEVTTVTNVANTVIITNYAMEKLPNTGGPGTIHYTAGGLLMIAATLILMYIHKKKPMRKA